MPALRWREPEWAVAEGAATAEEKGRRDVTMPGAVVVSLGRTIVLPFCDAELASVCEAEGAEVAESLGAALSDAGAEAGLDCAESEGDAEGAAEAESGAAAEDEYEGSADVADAAGAGAALAEALDSLDSAAEGAAEACDGASEVAGVADAEGAGEADASTDVVGTTGTSVFDSDEEACSVFWIWKVGLRPTWSLPFMKRIWAASALAAGVKLNDPSLVGTCAMVCHCPLTCTWICTLAGSPGVV